MEILHEKSKSEMAFHRGKWGRGLRPFHYHDKVEVVFPLDRPIIALLDGARYEAQAGDALVITGQAVHAFEIPEDDTGFMLGQFPYSILLSCGVLPGTVKPHITAAEIAASPTLSTQLSAILTALSTEGHVAPGESDPFMQSLLCSLYFLLARHFGTPAEGAREERERRDFRRIVTYVNAHYTEPLTVGSVAAALYIDRGKLSRLFLAYAGQPLTEYITTLRLTRATHLLREGVPVTVAALESGFQSVRTFHDVYKRTQHSTPRATKGK